MFDNILIIQNFQGKKLGNFFSTPEVSSPPYIGEETGNFSHEKPI